MQATINGIRMVYDVSGAETGPPVVLHHSLAMNMSLWDELAAVLAPRYRVIRFDARGHGQTEASKAPYTFEMLAADVVGLLDHLEINKAHFVGLSMGGMVGQFLGVLHPDRFASLTLASTSSRVPPEGRGLWLQRVTDTREKGIESQVQVAIPRWVTEANKVAKPEVLARLTKNLLGTPAEGFCGWAGAIATLDVTDRLKTIAVPTQVIVGEEDPGTPPAAARVIHNEIKGSSLIVAPKLSHMLCTEEPAIFNAYVTAFLDKQPAIAA
jgi:3-oxoadipate enol-lactonase